MGKLKIYESVSVVWYTVICTSRNCVVCNARSIPCTEIRTEHCRCTTACLKHTIFNSTMNNSSEWILLCRRFSNIFARYGGTKHNSWRCGLNNKSLVKERRPCSDQIIIPVYFTTDIQYTALFQITDIGNYYCKTIF